MTRSLLFVALAVLCAACTGGTEHVERDAFVGTGSVAPGGWLRVRNRTGRIVVDSTGGAQFSVTATKRWRHGGENVHFVQQNDSGGVLICTVYGDGGDCNASDSRSGRRSWSLLGALFGGGNDVQVDYLVRVPAGTRVDVSQVNGSVLVGGTTAAVRARTVNGSVAVAVLNAPVSAESVNGSIKASVRSAADSGDINLRTVNGSVTAELPAAIQGVFSLETVNGKLQSEFALPETANRRQLSGTLGAGGRTVKLRTVNGSVTLNKRS